MTKRITCKRCKGTGLVSSPVLHCGIPGGCFACDAIGTIFADKFIRELGDKGDFFSIGYFGITELRRGNRLAIESDLMSGATIIQISEEQARAFHKLHGFRKEAA